jgi:hypothetical protein
MVEGLPTNAKKWSGAYLDRMREVGDPLADAVVTTLFEAGGVYSVWELMKTLIHNDHPTPDQLPAQMKSYLEATSKIPPADPRMVELGQRLFQRCGPEILMVLACYSLPASYAARKGVQVLYRTGYLNNRATHRAFETTQMVMDVLSPGGLVATGRGVRTAQKVRLMHAAVRRLLLTDPENPWDNDLGVPINQEDLAGTLMVFTYIIIDGLDKLGISTSEEERQGFLETWNTIARIMGIREEMIPANMGEAKTLCETIQLRQVECCPEGKAMTDALLKMLEHQYPPGPLRRWPATLMRHFLPHEVADGFEIPHHKFEEHLLQQAVELRSELDNVAGVVDRRLWILRRSALLLLRFVVTAELGGKRTPFILPTNLHHGWAQSHRIGVWEQLRR